MHISFILMSILLLSIFSQWLAWKTRLPAILFLLLSGILVGPISEIALNIPGGFLNSSELFGKHLLYTFVELAVSIILFEGCLSLKVREIKGLGNVVRNLVSIGVVITAVATAVLTHYLFEFPWGVASLLGAITCVSGPTVVVPILRSVRPTRRLESVIKWEGMLIDPIGALLAALVFTSIIALTQQQAITEIIIHIIGVILLSLVLGVLGGYILGAGLRRHWVPDYLRNLFALSLVVVTFVVAEHIVSGAGLLSVTIMGVFVGNLWENHIDEVVDFKEHLSVLLISVLFIVLGANISFANLEKVIVPAIVLVLCLQFIIRPIVVFICSLGSELNWRERLMLGWIAPRGIVVAAVAALFSAKLISEGSPEYIYYGRLLSLIAFLVIIGTVLIPSLTAPYLARLLKVASPDPDGFLIVGANKLAIEIGKALQREEVSVVLADENWQNVQDARLAGLQCYHGNPTSEHADWHIDMVGIGRVLGLARYDQVNTLAAVKYYHELGSAAVYLLPVNETSQNQKMTLLNKRYSKRLFTDKKDFDELRGLIHAGAIIKCTHITSEYTMEDYLKDNYQSIIPLFAISPKRKVYVLSPDAEVSITEDWFVMSLFTPKALA